MTNRVPPRALLSTLALPARPSCLALRPSSACTAPSSPHHARPPSRLATHPLSKSHRGQAPSPRPAAACRHARCRAHSRYMPAPGLMRRCARPTHFATVWTRAARVHTCGRESPSRLRRPALLLHAARRVPALSTLHAALYTARAHPTAPYGAIPLPNKRCKWLGLGPPFPLFNPADVWELSSVRGVGACRHDRRGRARPQCMYTAEALFGALTSWPGLA